MSLYTSVLIVPREQGSQVDYREHGQLESKDWTSIREVN